MSGSAPVTGEISTATTTLYYRSFTDKETGAEDKGIYYNTAATGNVVWAHNNNTGSYEWSVKGIAENEYATQSENISIQTHSLPTNCKKNSLI